MKNERKIEKIIEPQYVIEGAGVRLRRSISPHRTNLFDPFLLFDHFAFEGRPEAPIQGFPMHPHRGIETVTYMIKGATHHRDSLGNSGLIGPGDVQWMTAGRGIMHEEMPRRDADGKIFGFQLWVNLPAKQKMAQPRYQEVTQDTIPMVEKDGVKIRLVAGSIDEVIGAVTEIAAAPLYMDVQLAADKTWEMPVPEGHTVVAYIFEGESVFADETVSAVKMVKYKDGDHIQVKTENSAVRFMLMAGAPFKEPIVPYGPFVMNTEEEIYQAINELRDGTFIKK